MRRLSVLIVDDNPLFAVAATRFLTDFCSVDVAGVAASGEEGIARSAELNPDIVLIDQSMSGMSGLEAGATIRTHLSPPVVVMVTLNASSAMRDKARMFGCDALVSKIEFTREMPGLIDSIRHRITEVARPA
jgi:DNA-binding NarL/FixJ family response regulator